MIGFDKLGAERWRYVAYVAFATEQVEPVIDAIGDEPLRAHYREVVAAFWDSTKRVAEGHAQSTGEPVARLVADADRLDIEVLRDRLLLETSAIPIDGVTVFSSEPSRAASLAAIASIRVPDSIEFMASGAGPRFIRRDDPFEPSGPITEQTLRAHLDAKEVIGNLDVDHVVDRLKGLRTAEAALRDAVARLVSQQA